MASMAAIAQLACATLALVLLAVIDAQRDDRPSGVVRTSTQGKIPAMEYLGCGYDILYGNPLADYGSLVDPGYRNPIISFTLGHRKGKKGSDMRYAKIPGAWTVVTSLKEYQKALSVDSEVGAGTVDESAKFSLSAGYAESSGLHLSTSRRLNIQRNYCFLLEAALPVNGTYTYTKAFKMAMAKLKPGFRKAAEECNTIRYAIKPDHPECRGRVQPWMTLFELFGTHFSYNIKIGGRLTEIAQVNSDDKSNSSSRSVEAGIKGQVARGMGEGSASISDSKASKRGIKENVSFTYVNVLGGRPIGNPDDEDEYLKWINSISQNPMPIRSQFAPLSKLFEDAKMKAAYDAALEFYMELKGVKTPEKKQDT